MSSSPPGNIRPTNSAPQSEKASQDAAHAKSADEPDRKQAEKFRKLSTKKPSKEPDSKKNLTAEKNLLEEKKAGEEKFSAEKTLDSPSPFIAPPTPHQAKSEQQPALDLAATSSAQLHDKAVGDIIERVTNRITASGEDLKAGGELHIDFKESVLAQTSLNIKLSNGQLQLQFSTASPESLQLLNGNKQRLIRHIEKKTGHMVTLSLRSKGNRSSEGEEDEAF